MSNKLRDIIRINNSDIKDLFYIQSNGNIYIKETSLEKYMNKNDISNKDVLLNHILETCDLKYNSVVILQDIKNDMSYLAKECLYECAQELESICEALTNKNNDRATLEAKEFSQKIGIFFSKLKKGIMFQKYDNEKEISKRIDAINKAIERLEEHRSELLQQKSKHKRSDAAAFTLKHVTKSVLLVLSPLAFLISGIFGGITLREYFGYFGVANDLNKQGRYTEYIYKEDIYLRDINNGLKTLKETKSYLEKELAKFKSKNEFGFVSYSIFNSDLLNEFNLLEDMKDFLNEAELLNITTSKESTVINQKLDLIYRDIYHAVTKTNYNKKSEIKKRLNAFNEAIILLEQEKLRVKSIKYGGGTDDDIVFTLDIIIKVLLILINVLVLGQLLGFSLSFVSSIVNSNSNNTMINKIKNYLTNKDIDSLDKVNIKITQKDLYLTMLDSNINNLYKSKYFLEKELDKLEIKETKDKLDFGKPLSNLNILKR